MFPGPSRSYRFNDLIVVIASDGAARAWSIPIEQVEWLRARAVGTELIHVNNEADLRGAPLLNVVDKREGY